MFVERPNSRARSRYYKTICEVHSISCALHLRDNEILRRASSTFLDGELRLTGWHFNNGPVRLERGGVLQLLRITQVLLMALTDKKWIQAPILTRPYDL